MLVGLSLPKARLTFLSALLLFGVFLGPEAISAQGVSYTTVSKGEFGGSLGTLMSLVPGAQDESRETTHLQGLFMRTDSDEQSTIMSFGEGRFTVLQHPEKSFFSYTMEEMMASMSAGMAEAGADRTAGMGTEARGEQDQDPEVTFEVKMSSERTGRTMEIQSYPAEQFLMLVEVVPASEKAMEEAADSGSMAVLTEVWISKEVPGWEELKKGQQDASQAMGSEALGAQAEALQQALASDPRMQDAYKENLEALEEMDGLAIKTVTSFVMVPPGKTLDEEQVLAMADQPLSEGAGGVVADAAADAAKEEAEQAARGAVRNLTRGILGRRRQEPEPTEEAQPEAVQFILMRVTSTVEGIKTGPLPVELFQPPADYQEKDPPWLGSGGGGVQDLQGSR